MPGTAFDNKAIVVYKTDNSSFNRAYALLGKSADNQMRHTMC